MGTYQKTANKLFLFVLSLITMVSFQNCGYTGASDPETFMSLSSAYSSVPTYKQIYFNIIQPKCLSCHSSGSPNFTSYETMMTTGSVVASNPTASTFYTKILSGAMPKGGGSTSAADKTAIYNWILAGAISGSAPATIPNAPTSVLALATSATEALISWTLPLQSVTATKVERADAISGPFAVVANILSAVSSYADTGLAVSTTYYYRISVTNSAGTSQTSNVVSVTTLSYPPAPASALIATSTSATQINLTWLDNSADETGFAVQRASSALGTYVTVANLAANSTSYVNAGLSPSTIYYYRVQAIGAGGSTSDSNVASATTLAAVTGPPLAPSALAATAVSANQINLSWTDNSTSESGFKVERGTSVSGPFSLVTTTAANINTYSNVGLSASTTYYYRVSATNTAGDSAYTSIANAMTQAAAVSAPTAPSTLAATAASASQINLSWADNSTNETGFKVGRGTSAAGPFSIVSTTAAGVTSYSDTGLTSSVTYYYRISATNTAGDSAFTAVANATTQASAPATPTTLSSVAASSSQVNLTWTDSATNETAYKVERSTAVTGPFTVVATLASNTTTYADTGLSAVVTYYYRVNASNTGGNSGYSPTASATTSGTFTWVNANIIQSSCVGCHSAVGPSAGYSMSSYANVMTQVTPSNANGSLMYQRVIDSTMPRGSTPLTTIERNAIRSWIDGGAQNN